jgi:putative GTP pyrophosphokinase
MAELERRDTAFSRFALPYRIAIATLTMEVSRLKQEFTRRGGARPILAVSARIKTHDSIVTKARRLSCPLTADDIRTNILDVAGLRITCTRISDTYLTAVRLSELSGVTLIEVEDYNAKPKPNGYTSLHLVIEIPVRLRNRTHSVPVEVQIKALSKDLRTKREHTIDDNSPHEIPGLPLDPLPQTADAAYRLDAALQSRQEHIMLWATPNADDGDRNSPPRIGLDVGCPTQDGCNDAPRRNTNDAGSGHGGRAREAVEHPKLLRVRENWRAPSQPLQPTISR